MVISLDALERVRVLFGAVCEKFGRCVALMILARVGGSFGLPVVMLESGSLVQITCNFIFNFVTSIGRCHGLLWWAEMIFSSSL